MEVEIKLKKINNETSPRKRIKSKTFANNNKNLSLNSINADVKNLGIITTKLLEMGYSPECVNFCVHKYKFSSLEQILNIIEKDHETGIYNHQFFPLHKFEKNKNYMGRSKTFEDTCIICKDVKKFHPKIESLNILPHIIIDNLSGLDGNDSVIHNKQNVTISQLLNKSDVMTDKCKLDIPSEYSKNDSIKKTEIKVNPKLIAKLTKDFEEKTNLNLCLICFDTELNDENSLKLPCGHIFCKACLDHYLSEKINNALVEHIKCLMAGCVKPIEESTIKQIVNEMQYKKYMKFKKRATYLSNIKNGLIPCVFPDCEEWLPYQEGDSQFVRCNYGHEFCAVCKQLPHPKKKCKNVEIERITKNNQKIKPCPKCFNLIEKIDGCNHITCSLCKYEFCWLCSKKYTSYHFSMFNVSGCPGMRFGKLLINNILLFS